MADKQRQGKGDAKSGVGLFDFSPGGAGSWLRAAAPAKRATTRQAGLAVYVGIDADLEAVVAKLGTPLPDWLVERLLKKRGEIVAAHASERPVWLILAQPKPPAAGHGGVLEYSAYGVARDVSSAMAAQAVDYGLTELEVRFEQADEEEQLGALVGLELGAYRYRQVRQPKGGQDLPRLTLPGVPAALIERAASLGSAVNLARHLVNVPAGELTPETLAAGLTAMFAGSSTMTVDVWSGKRLEKERMGLLRAVGQGAASGPALVVLRYRPKRARGRPVAFVGKGVTFDTGGLDIKDAGSMRLMKKDMGGAASLCGLAHWVEATGLGVACDFYLALAENAVDKDSFHPGDVLTARSGMTVEIDNTDAEGRLVLADALDVAVSVKGREAPAALIDLATLTGAMRVALGTRLAGLFATDDPLAAALLAAGQRRADPAWRLPLYADYLAGLKSVVADIANSGPSRFGGAITAALFLQRFVGAVPWAHFDMYAWTEANIGGCAEVGGNGQCVQLLSEFLTQWGVEG